MEGVAVAVAVDTSLVDQRIRELRNLKNPAFMAEALNKVKRFVKIRIFIKGLDSQASPIGQYAPSYIIRRVKKGLGTSSRVVLRFTLRMMGDFQVIQVLVSPQVRMVRLKVPRWAST